MRNDPRELDRDSGPAGGDDKSLGRNLTERHPRRFVRWVGNGFPAARFCSSGVVPRPRPRQEPVMSLQARAGGLVLEMDDAVRGIVALGWLEADGLHGA